MKQEMQRELTGRILPFWQGLIDRENGGFYGQVGFDLQTQPEAPKGVILNSRILWFFANSVLATGDKALLPYGEQAYRFLRDYCIDPQFGGVYWEMNRKGEPLDTTKHTYNQAFAIYALSSYYQAAGCEEALALAMKLFRLIEETCTDAYGYQEAFERDWQPAENDKLSENGLLADKTMNTLLHVLEAYTELYRVSGGEAVGRRLEELLRLFADKVYNPERQRLEVFFDCQMNSIADMQSYGHDIEATWLLDRACRVLGKEELARLTRAYLPTVAQSVYERALQKDGSLINECFEGKTDPTRVWWVQAEGAVGFWNAWELTGNEAYRDAAKGLWAYIKKAVIDPRPGGEWFWDVDEAGEPTSQKPIVEPWKCPYHNGRMCMELMTRIKERD